MWKDLQNPQKHMPNEGIFNLAVSTFFNSNKSVKPFWDSEFLKDAPWDQFMKTFPVVGKDGKDLPEGPGDPWNDKPTEGDPDNLWTMFGNPYMKAVKHDQAAEDAVKKKLPVWVGPKKFRFGDIPKKNRTLANLNMLNWYIHNSYIEIPMSQHMAIYFDSKAEKAVQDSIESVGQVLTGTWGLTGVGGVIGGAMGGPMGAVFGAAAGRWGSKVLKGIVGTIGKVLGSVIGMGLVEMLVVRIH